MERYNNTEWDNMESENETRPYDNYEEMLENEQQQGEWEDTEDKDPTDDAEGNETPRVACGLANAGATCYMNSILVQLFTIGWLREAIMNLPLSPWYQQRMVPRPEVARLYGEKIDPNTQHDAAEFFTSLTNSLDVGLRVMDFPPHMDIHFGGALINTITCFECRKSTKRDEHFTVLPVAIQHGNLDGALTSYFSNELLFAENKYHCENCNKKVMGTQQPSLTKLPQVLTIQINRTSFCQESGNLIKRNDRFEFPYRLNLGQFVQQNQDEEGGAADPELYRLRGVVVHHGTSDSGHYWSYVMHRVPSHQGERWHIFNDDNVWPCTLDPPNMDYCCFGGNYTDSSGNLVEKRWSAAMLFYEKVDTAKFDAIGRALQMHYQNKKEEVKRKKEEDMKRKKKEEMKRKRPKSLFWSRVHISSQSGKKPMAKNKRLHTQILTIGEPRGSSRGTHTKKKPPAGYG